MAIRDVFKVNRKTFIDPRAWLGYDFVKAQTVAIYRTLRGIFVETPPEHQETFEEAVRRQNLTEQDLKLAQQNYLLNAFLFAGLGAAALGLGIYLLTVFSIAGFILSTALVIFLFGQAFRNHFWYFQIKHRKLGCTFEEWRNGKLNDEGPAP